MSLSLTNDFIFKYVLGREQTKDVLKDLINTVLSDSGFDLILDLSIMNPTNLRQTDWSKETILDIKAIDSQHRTIDIEIQVEFDVEFAKRSLYYWAQAYSGQLNKGSKYEALNPVLCINFLDFSLFKDLKSGHNCFKLLEIKEKEYIMTNDLEIHFIELTKTGTNQERLEQWVSILKNIDKEDEKLKVLLDKDPIFRKVNEEYQRCVQLDEVKELALAREKYQRDVASRLDQAHRAGIAEGEARGEEKGKAEGQKETKFATARAMKEKGFDAKTITEITGLSEEELAGI